MPEPQPPAAHPPEAPPRHVFVYGTLRRGGSNDINRLAPAPRFVGTARVRGTLYHLGAYPGLVLDPQGADVVGEVYAITPELEVVLDTIEEILPHPSGEYAKREIDIALDAAAAVPQPGAAAPALRCLVYEIAPTHLRDRRCIDCGDWVLATAHTTM